jgi:predicted ATPase/DNA-binding SARP family transcriptional activator
MNFLGGPRIELDGSTLNLDTRKATALLAYLAISGQTQGRDTLSALLWSDYDQSHARGALRRTLSVLNRSLNMSTAYLEISRESISLIRSSGYWVDVEQFRAKIAQCETHGHSRQEVCPRCIPPLKAAAELYHGDFLAGFSLRDSPEFDEWEFFTSESLRREYSNALQKLIEALSGRGDSENAIQYARRWLAVDPLLEEAHRVLMQLYDWSGQRNAALRQYQECKRILEQELGVSPLLETNEIYQAILEQRLPGPLLFNMGGSAGQDVSTPGREPEDLETPQYPLVGRSAETVTILHTYQNIAANGYFLGLYGEAGIGKTRLAEEFLAYARRQGAVTLTARCYQGENYLAYAPLIDSLRAALERPECLESLRQAPNAWLVEAARLLPEINDLFPALRVEYPSQNLGQSPAAQEHFFEGIRQSMAALGGTEKTLAVLKSPPAVLFLDDIQWADQGTLELLAYLVRRLEGWRFLVLVTSRDDPSHSSQLDGLVAEARRYRRGERLDLTRLKPNHVEDLVRAIRATGLELPEGLGQRLYQEAEGLPFFIVEYLTALQEDSRWQTDGFSMPGSVRDLLRSRLSGVDEAGLQLLTTAAVIGRSFDYEILREVSGRSEAETIAAIETLLNQKIISEQDGEVPLRSVRVVYDFFHDKLRELVYEEASQPRLLLLHRRVAEALIHQARSKREAGERAGEIAYHYQRAGFASQAAEYFRQAGDYSRSVYANSQALAHFQSALVLGYPDAAGLYETIGDLHILLGNYQQARDSYTAAAPLCIPGCRFDLEYKLGDVSDRLGEWEQAERHFQSALEAIPEDCRSEDQARLYAIWSRTAYHGGQSERARDLAQSALSLAQQSGEMTALAQAYNTLGMLARSQGRLEEAIACFNNSLETAQASLDPAASAAALNNLSLTYRDCDELERAIRSATAALELCVKQGDRHRQAAIHNNLADLFHALDDADQSMYHLKKAVEIFSSVGDETGDLKPETWKLTDW